MAVSGVINASPCHRLGRSVGSRHGRVRGHCRTHLLTVQGDRSGHGTTVSVVIDASISSPFRAIGRVTALPGSGWPTIALDGTQVFLDHHGHGHAGVPTVFPRRDEGYSSTTTDTAVP